MALNESPESSTEHVFVFRQGVVGRIHLNRPRALNSLTLGMVRAIAKALVHFERDPEVRCVLIDGEGSRGLCAGGDIRAIYESGRRLDGEAELFWREEYILNARIAAFPKPYIAIMDGITMGGGIGIAAHGSHRIVTERSRIAMPEVGIGFVPDVGGTWLLSRTPGALGTYLALTGEIIGAGDTIRAGLADAMVPSGRLPALVDALASLARPAGSDEAGSDEVEDILQAYARPADDGMLWQHRDLIDQCFSHSSIEEILAALADVADDFARATLLSLRGKSPTSLKVTLRLLHLAHNASLEDCLLREFRAAVRCLQGHDFYEGIRAAIIDKDRSPRWQPDTIGAVSEADIDRYLAPVHAGEPVFSYARKV
jgi:enoyl-CoA hydratase